MSKNDITGDDLKTKPATDSYRKNFERIFNGAAISEIEANETNPSIEQIRLLKAQNVIGRCFIMLHMTQNRTSVQEGMHQVFKKYLEENCAEFFETFKL